MSDKVLGGVFYMGLNWGVALESLEFLSWRKHCSVQPYQVHFVTESQDFALIYSLSPVVTKQSISNALFPRWAHHGHTARSAKSKAYNFPNTIPSPDRAVRKSKRADTLRVSGLHSSPGWRSPLTCPGPGLLVGLKSHITVGQLGAFAWKSFRHARIRIHVVTV